MGSFVLETTEEEDKKLQTYALKYNLSGKIEAIKKLIAEINLEIKASK
jgi:hypothetical protein